MSEGMTLPNGDEIARVAQLIEETGIHAVRVSLCDLHGIARGRPVPARAFLDRVARDGMFMTNFLLAIDTAVGIAPVTSIDLTNGFPNWRMVPDLTTLTPLPWAPGQARVIADLYDPDGQPAALPRRLLKSVLAEAQRDGFTVDSALEYEFYVFRTDATGNRVPFDLSIQYASELVHAQAEDIWAPIFAAMEGMGIGVEAVQHEYTHGQLEINLAHQRGLRAADDGFQFKTSVKEILARRGYLATFMAKPLNTGNANGCHLHVSLLDGDGHNLFNDPAAEHGVSQAFWHFLAGQLEHAAGMMVLTSPTLNCYKRLVPNRFAPLAATWGWEDRTVLIRIPMQRGPATHLENRIASAAGNPYLVTAAILAAGLDGIRCKAPLPDGQNAPSLPRSMPEALDALQADTVMVRTFGEQFVRDYVAIKTMEVERARTYVTDWDRQEYMEMF